MSEYNEYTEENTLWEEIRKRERRDATRNKALNRRDSQLRILLHVTLIESITTQQ